MLDRLQAVRSLATGFAVGMRRAAHDRLLPLDLPGRSEPPTIGQWVRGASIADLQAAMAAGTLTSVELTQYLLARIGADEPRRHSLISINASALAQAREADARRAVNATGPLLGIPVTIKDNIEVAGAMPTTGGAEILIENMAAADAELVTRLRAAGAVILGKANLSELAGAVVATPGFSAVGGMSRNPFGDTFSPGGSSSGSAVGVAAGLAIASVGSETSGSLTAPASCNGLVTIKPTYGTVPSDGVIPLVRHQDCVGPITRTVGDAAIMLQVLTGGATVAESGGLRGVRVGLLATEILGQRSSLEDTSDAPELLARIRGRLQDAGSVPRDIELVAPAKSATLEGDLLTVVFGGLAYDTVDYLRAAGAPVATLAELQRYNLRQPRRRMPAGQSLVNLAVLRGVQRTTYESEAMSQRARAQRILDDTFGAADADVLVSVSNLHSWLYATAGYPAITIPAGPRASGMPTGITMIGRAGSDPWLIGLAEALEATG